MKRIRILVRHIAPKVLVAAICFLILLISVFTFFAGCEPDSHPLTVDTGLLPSDTTSGSVNAWNLLYGRIAYQERRTNGREFWSRIVVIDGDKKTITRFPESAQQPLAITWSYDGKKLAYLLGGSLFVVSVQESVLTDIKVISTSDNNWNSPGPAAWFRDGRLAYSYGIYRYFPFNSSFQLRIDETIILDNTAIRPSRLAISPNGRYIVFPVHDDSARISLYRFDLSTDQLSILLQSDPAITYEQFIEPCFSPDGLKVVFTRRVVQGNQQRQEVWCVDLDGTNLIRITSSPNGYGDVWPTWAPDGKKLLFVRNGNLYLINVDGTGMVQVTSMTSRYPSWIW